MKKYLLSLISFLFFYAFINGQTIDKAVICDAVKSMEPVNVKDNFNKGDKAYCWIRVSGATVGSKIKVAWHLDEQLVYTSQLSMKYASMRTYSYKTLTSEGNWRADIQSPEGKVLASLAFNVGAANSANGKTNAEFTNTKNSTATNTSNSSAKTNNSKTAVTKTNKPTEKKDYSKPNKLTLAEGFQLEIKEESKVLLPPGYDKTKKYPALIFLPPTNMSGEEMYINYCLMVGGYGSFEANQSNFDALLRGLFKDDKERKEKSFIVILPGGRGSTKDHSWKGFAACIHRYEQRILKDLETFIPKYNIDSKNIVLTGFSLGGDLSWAITHRYPGKFKGAIVMGSRCSYHEKGKLELLAKNQEKYYLVMGELESEVRLKIFNQSKDLLDKHKIKYLYRKVPNEGHSPATFDQFIEAIDFVMFDK